MSTIFTKFNEEKNAIFNPTDFTKPIEGFPEICVSTFSKEIIDKFSAKEGVEKIADLSSTNGNTPVYKMKYQETEIAFFMSMVGAPACVGLFEEVIAMGAKKFVLFGSCGMLDENVKNNIIVPTSAIRDEGTSYHYVAKSDEISMKKQSVDALVTTLESFHYPYTLGKSWTTDAVYRETPTLISERKKQGCIVVEMELSAMLAVSQFRNIPFAQFLYGADCLDNNEWDVRDLCDHGIEKADVFMELAFACGIAL